MLLTRIVLPFILVLPATAYAQNAPPAQAALPLTTLPQTAQQQTGLIQTGQQQTGLTQTELTPQAADNPSRYAKWNDGISRDPSYFPIAVWLQSPQNASRYRQAGINLYVGLWRGPTEEQLSQLKRAKMQVICNQNEVGLTSPDKDVIVGWMHGDEPDNAQSRRDGQGYDPPILPSVIAENYDRIRQKDAMRPILLNLGQGVAFDNYIGRGVRRNHPEDYAEYIRGSDIVSFDIYPAVHDHRDVAGKLEFVPEGVQRLRRWSNDQKIVWNCIESSRISNTKTKPTAHQISSEVWMSIIYGSRGIIYFVHQFQPGFVEASLLDDAELLQAVTQINSQIQRLAPVINAGQRVSASVVPYQLEDSLQPSVAGRSLTPDAGTELNDSVLARAKSDNPIALMAREMPDGIYLFAANISARAVTATIELPRDDFGIGEVIDEARKVDIQDRKMTDAFEPYGVHLYRAINKAVRPGDER